MDEFERKTWPKALEIARQFDGWTVTEARAALALTMGIIRDTARFDMSGPDFTSTVEEFEQNAAEFDRLPR